MNKYLLILFVISSIAYTQDQQWKRIMPGIQIGFPRDHGSHPEYQTEWWYATGQVTDTQGNEWGYQFTIFRFGIDPASKQDSDSLYTNHLLIGHLGITNINSQTFFKAERIRRAGAGYAEASETQLHAWIGDWEIGQDENNKMTISATDLEKDISINLTLNPLKAPTFHGENGYSQKGGEVGNASAYYTWTRLQTEGTIDVEGKEYEVTGTSWFDHEWGSSQLGEGVAGWDWFGIHLDDGSELMLYQLRFEEGGAIPQSSASLVSPSGESIQINVEDWSLKPISYWESPQTKGNYPIVWQLSIPKHNIQVTIRAKVKQTEMITNRSTGITYWEGPVGITGTKTGSGYMELTGYAGIFSNTF